jgi:hypothetical protein
VTSIHILTLGLCLASGIAVFGLARVTLRGKYRRGRPLKDLIGSAGRYMVTAGILLFLWPAWGVLFALSYASIEGIPTCPAPPSSLVQACGTLMLPPEKRLPDQWIWLGYTKLIETWGPTAAIWIRFPEHITSTCTWVPRPLAYIDYRPY